MKHTKNKISIGTITTGDKSDMNKHKKEKELNTNKLGNLKYKEKSNRQNAEHIFRR